MLVLVLDFTPLVPGCSRCHLLTIIGVLAVSGETIVSTQVAQGPEGVDVDYRL